MMQENRFESEPFWNDVWLRHIETYLASPPRAGYWLDRMFPEAYSVLEIAGGSCRDSHYLATRGRMVIGSDFEAKTINYVQRRLSHPNFRIEHQNAFALGYESKSFDLTFSNGFWICFKNDAQIVSLIQEQARVSRKYLVALLHNDENESLKEVFWRKAIDDPLYDIRFFRRTEVMRLLGAANVNYKSVRFAKFGGLIDLFYSRQIRGISNPFRILAPRFAPSLYALQPWSKVERIVCCVEL